MSNIGSLAVDDVECCISNALCSPTWRLNNLYKVRNKSGDVVTFKPNPVQKDLFDNMHTRTVIPKARQHGITTAVALYFVDCCMCTPNLRCAIIAHRESDAIKIFATKIKFPIEHIDEDLKPYFPKVKRMTSEVVEFSNGSVLYADTMVRSDTLNHLHISELGKMAAWYPVKAEEVRTGAFPAAEKGQIIIESTMEGNFGLMAEISNKAYKLKERRKSLGPKDFKLLFYPWHASADYQLDDKETLDNASEELLEYFRDLDEIGVSLTDKQKTWYLSEFELLGFRMKQEYPSTYEESISTASESSFFGKYVAAAKYEKRVCALPHDSHSRTYASFDIGIGDPTAIWVFQIIRNEIHFVDYLEKANEDIAYHMNWLARKSYAIDRIVLPHDAKAREKSTGLSYEDFIRNNFQYKTMTLDRDAHEILGIEQAWKTFPKCYFDRDKCATGIESLTFFAREYDRVHERYLGKSVHDKYSDGAKSFIYACEAIDTLSQDSSTMSLDEYRKLKARHRRIV